MGVVDVTVEGGMGGAVRALVGAIRGELPCLDDTAAPAMTVPVVVIVVVMVGATLASETSGQEPTAAFAFAQHFEAYLHFPHRLSVVFSPLIPQEPHSPPTGC